jgi:predicted MFS family arabinose efflux permease
MGRVANRIFIDLDPLRESRDFRLLFAGQLAGVFGSQLTLVAIAFQVYAVTGSSLQVGAVSLVQLVPLILGALIGGTVGDAVDRRGILVVTSLSLGLTSGLLAFNAASSHPSVLVIYLVSAVAAGVGGMASTACNAAVPSLVQFRHLVAAYASMQVVDQLGMVVAPALAGLLIEAIHLEGVYALVAGAYAVTALAMVRMSPSPPAPGASRAGFGSVLEGMRYLRRRPVLQGAFLIDINAMVFGMPRALFPALAVTVFHGGSGTLGLLFAAPGAGALLGALTTGWLAQVRRQGVAVIVAVCAWGTAIALFGLIHILWIGLVLLMVAGWADVISAVLRTTIIQSSVPEEFRSRISSLQIAVVEGGPRLGDIESGAVATLVSTGFSVVSGGLACVAGALVLAAALPGFRTFDRAAPRADGAPPAPDVGLPGAGA